MELRLSELHVLALDCMAIGANPDKGQPLEIGWRSWPWAHRKVS